MATPYRPTRLAGMPSDALLDMAVDAARAAGELILERFRGQVDAAAEAAARLADDDGQ